MSGVTGLRIEPPCLRCSTGLCCFQHSSMDRAKGYEVVSCRGSNVWPSARGQSGVKDFFNLSPAIGFNESECEDLNSGSV
jgi:hypothetical protein